MNNQHYRNIRKTLRLKRVGVWMLAAATGAATSMAEEAADTLTLNLGEVVATGTNRPVGRNLLPYTVSVIGPDALEATGRSEVLSAVSGLVPSLFVTQRSVLGFGVSNGGSGQIKLRGIDGGASNVLMMVDGQPQFAGIYSHHIADFYQMSSVERVEVLRGPGSVLYGSNAMAGAINVITKNATETGTHARLTTQYGSYNTWQNMASVSHRSGRFQAYASGQYDRTDGTVKGFDFRQASGYGKLQYAVSDSWKVAADYTISNFTGNDPVYPKIKEGANADGVYHQNVTRGDASVSATNRYEKSSGSIMAYYSYGNHFIDDPNHFHSTDDRFGVLLYQNFKPWVGADATAGFDFNTYSGRIPMSGGREHGPGNMGTIDRKTVTEYSPYVTLAQSLLQERLSVNAGLRMANSDKFGTSWIPQGGVAFRLPAGFHAKGSVASGYRNPSFKEMYLYRMANPDLKPERLTTYELSAGWSSGSVWSGDVTVYFAEGSEMIQELDMLNVNTGSFRNKGVEVSGHYTPRSNLTLSASYSYLHTTLEDLTGAPRHQYFAGVQWSPIKALKVSADVKGVSKLFVSEKMALQSYALLDLKFDYRICRYVAVQLRLDNVTNARYTINYGYEMPGFTAFGGLTLSI